MAPKVKGGTKQKQKGQGIISAFFKRKASTSEEHSPLNDTPEHTSETTPINIDISVNALPVQGHAEPIELVVGSLERDPSKRIPIWKYSINQQDEIRRAYISMGPYQPKLSETEYKLVKCGKRYRRFKPRWFKQFPWLEYSDSAHKAYCFPCYLFEVEDARFTTFTRTGSTDYLHVNASKSCPFISHEGGPNSSHAGSKNRMADLMNVKCHVDKKLQVANAEEKKKNRFRFKIIIEVIRWLTVQGCALRGHDESSSSANRGNFLEMLTLLGKLNLDISEVLEMAPRNATYTSSDIQKNFLHILANKIRVKIREEIGGAKFSILVDEAKDASDKEQMAIVLRFVDNKGVLRERFFAIAQVADTSASTLKKAICDVLGQYNLHISDMRGQGYDGASNMRGSWNGLQALFLRDSPSAYYVHCFAHRLQLALVAAAESEVSIWLFFSKLNSIVNLIRSSPKRQAELQEAQAIEVENMVISGERDTGRGANQVCNLQRAGKTRWSSHFESICSLVDMYSSVIAVLKIIIKDGSSRSMRGEAAGCLREMQLFDFVFILSLMHKIMGVTNLLCKALQGEAMDILNAMESVSVTKTLLQQLRDDGYDILLMNVKTVCVKYGIDVPNMDALYQFGTGRSCQQRDAITFEHHYQFDVFHAAIDFQVEELNNRFNDDAVELLRLSSALEPKDNFKSFNAQQICDLGTKFYPNDFSGQEMHLLRSQLAHYEVDVLHHVSFQHLTTISELCQRLVETNKTQHYNLIDRLVRLILTLPVSTATTERAFSAMKLVKTTLRNKMEKDYLTDSLVVYIERELARSIDEDSIIDDFYTQKNRRVQL
ncbi:hypothetical protein OROMI_017085 [Orobanche minor]